MVPCGLAGHMQCTVSVSSHTIHLRVVNFFSSFLALNNFTEFCWIFFITIVMYLFINFVYYNYYLYEYFLSIFAIECFIMPNRIFLCNEYSYLQPVLHLYACMYYELCS